MGMSVSAATAIMFTTFVILFAVIFGAIDNYQSSTINAQQQNLDREQEIRDTEIGLVSVNLTTDQIVLLNSGSSTIQLSDMDLLLDGVYVQQSSYTTQISGVGQTNLWNPGEELIVQSLVDLDGAHIKVTVNGWSSIYYTG